jgi:tetratricopeptide (TPR) repeat protein
MGDPDESWDRAMDLHWESEQQALSGRLQEALDSELAAVALFRIAAANPHHADSYASALVDLSVRHAAIGDLDQATSVSTEAVALLRRLAPESERATTDLAAALMNLADQQLALGRHDLALEPALEAADRYRALCGTNLHAFRSELAGSLEILGACEAQLGQASEARESMQQALAVYEELAANDPEAFAEELVAARVRLRDATNS